MRAARTPAAAGASLHRDGFRQVPGLVDVEAAQAGDAVGEQLQRYDGQHGLQERRRARDVDDVVRVVLDVLVAVRRDRDHVGAAGAHLLDVRHDLVVHPLVVGGDHDDRSVLVEQGDGAVLHLPCRVRLGRDVRDLLQLQRPLERDRQADVAPEVEKERLVEVAPRDVVDRVVAAQERLDLRPAACTPGRG